MPLLYQVCGRTNKQRDINFLQRLRHSMLTFIAWKWEEWCYQTIGLYYSGYNRAGWRVLYVSVSLSAITSLHSPLVWLLQRQVVCDRLLCQLSKKTLHLSHNAASSLFSSLCWFSENLLPQLTHSLPFLCVWIKSSIYQSQAKTQSLASSLAFDQLSLKTAAYRGEAYARAAAITFQIYNRKCHTHKKKHTHTPQPCCL